MSPCRTVFACVAPLLLLACGASPAASDETTAAALDSSPRPITRDAFAKAMQGEREWIDGATQCELTIETSGSDLVVTLTSDGDTESLRISPDAVITATESDRYTEWNVAGVGRVHYLESLDKYVELVLTPAKTDHPVTCGMYWG